MRRRIAVIGSGETARAVALMLLARDDAELTLVGEPADDLLLAAVALGVEPRVEAVEASDLHAVELAVLTAVDEGIGEVLARRSPDAVALVATPNPAADCERLRDVLRWPRSRVFGRAGGTASEAGPALVAAQVAQLADHMAADRRRPLPVVALGCGPDEHDGWEVVQALVGAEGLAELLKP